MNFNELKEEIKKELNSCINLKSSVIEDFNLNNLNGIMFSLENGLGTKGIFVSQNENKKNIETFILIDNAENNSIVKSDLISIIYNDTEKTLNKLKDEIIDIIKDEEEGLDLYRDSFDR